MTGFPLWFGLAMAVFPLAFLLWYVRRPIVRERLDAEGAGDVLRGARHLAMVETFACVAAIVILVTAFSESPSGLVTGVGVGGFHLVWWTAVARVLRITERHEPGLPGDVTSQRDTTVRAASLTPRSVTDAVPAWWWSLPITALVAGSGWIALQAARTDLGTAAGLWAVLGPLGALAFLVSYGFWVRHAAIGPQDLSGAVDPDRFERACDDFRRFFARGVFWCMTAAVVVFVGAGVAIVATADDPSRQGLIGGIVGGGGGALVGLMGGVFGTLASLKRMQLDRIRRGDDARVTAAA